MTSRGWRIKSHKNVEIFPAREGWNPVETIAHCQNEASQGIYADVIVLAFDDEGQLITRSSNMSRQQANWMVDFAKMSINGLI